MTSSYYEGLGRATDAPVTGSYDNQIASYFDPKMSEEPDMTEAVNKEATRLDADRKQYYNDLANQYNKMFENRSRDYDRLQRIIGRQVPSLARDIKVWNEKTKPYREAWNWYNRALDFQQQYQADPNIPIPEWIKASPESEQVLKRIVEGDLAAAIPEVQKEDSLSRAEQASREETNAYAYQQKGAEKQEALDGLPDNDGIGVHRKTSIFYKDAKQIKQDFEYTWWDNGAETLRVPVEVSPGNFQLMSFAEATKPEHIREIANQITLHFLQDHSDKVGGRFGRYSRHVLKDVYDVTQAKIVSKLKEVDAIIDSVAEETAAEDLQNRLEADPGYLVDHINLNVGAHGSYAVARKATAELLYRYAKTGVLDRATIEAALDHEFLAHDGTVTTPRKYWKEDSAKILSGVQEFETEEANRRIADHKAKYTDEANDIAFGAMERKTPYSEEEKWNLVQKFMTKYRLTYEEVPDSLKNLFTTATVPDRDIDRELTVREARGETLGLEDIQGIEGIELKKKWLDKIGAGTGLDTSTRDTFITAAVGEKTQETDLSTAKTIKYRAYESNAKAEYNRVYLAEKATGANDAQAAAKAREAVITGLKLGSPNDSSWAYYGAVPHAIESKAKLGRTQKAVAKDINLLSKETPLEGEEDAIKQAILYTQNKKTNVPTFYRNFPGIRYLPNGEVFTPYRLMRYRLKSLGLIKDGELAIPEDDLPPYLQQQLRKPNPSKTLRVINNEDGIRLIDSSRFSSYDKGGDIEVDAVQELRSKAQTSQQYALIDSSYRTLVNIPEELNNEFLAQVGELPPYLQLNNLQPEVAKAFVADVLMA